MRWTVSAYPAGWLLSTVTRSETGAGAAPAVVVPKLSVAFSSDSESAASTWTSTAAVCVALGPVGGVIEHACAAEAEFRGAGAAAVKSAAFASRSEQPEPPRIAAVVLLSAGAAPLPS